MMPLINDAMLTVSGSLAASTLAKVTVTTALALAGAWSARRSRAAVRHVVLAAAFAVLLALPIASIVTPPISVVVPGAAQAATAPSPVEAIADPASSAAPVDGGAAVTRGSVRSTWLSPPALLVAGWTAGATLFLLPVVVGLWQMRALRRSGLPWRHGRSVVDPLALEAGIGRHVDVLLHETIQGPMTCGVGHPAIVLPMDAQIWPEEDLRRAIVHELEHVRRGDWVTQCLARTVCAAYWFHPLVWIAWRQLALEAERACDDAVLRRSEATAYADQLVVLAQRLSTAPSQPQLAMANRHDLATRVVAVLDSRQPRGRAGARWVGLVGAVSALLVTTISPLRIVAGAETSQTASASVQRFDAASIKPCRPDDSPPGLARGGAGGTNASISPGRMYVPCVTLEQLIYLAYAGTGATVGERLVNDNPGQASDATKVRGGPAWVHSQREKFAVEATAAGASDRNVLLGAMLRTLLEDRFQLKIHRETEEVPMYALSVARGGFKLKPMKDGDCDPDHSAPFDPDAAKPLCSSMNSRGNGPNTVWTFAGFEVSALSARLSRILDRHVIDQTGIAGEFIIGLEFHPDENTPGIKWPADRDANETVPQAASIFTALEQQLGLKVERTKAPRGFLVIDHAERLSSNSPLAIAQAPSPGSVTGAMEATLKEDLFRIRYAIDQYHSDKGRYPASLDALVSDGYLRKIPEDPFTSTGDWRTVRAAEPDPKDPSGQPGIRDVKSVSDGVALDGTKYADW